MRYFFLWLKRKFCSHNYEFHHWAYGMKYNTDTMIKKCTECGQTIYGGDYFMPDLLNNKCSWDVKDE